MAHRTLALFAIIATTAGCGQSQEIAADNSSEPATQFSDAPENAGGELPTDRGNGPYQGIMVSYDGSPIRVAYREIGGMAVVGGDMIIGRHDEMQRRIGLLRDLEDGDIDSANVGAAQKQAVERLNDLAEAEGNRITSKKYLPSVIKTFGWGTTDATWPARRVPYQFGASIPAGQRQTSIREGVEIWNAGSPIKLAPADEFTPAERQRVGVIEFVDHTDPDTDFACSSWVGHHPFGGRQEVYLNPRCEAGNVAHEIGHAIGLHHEHQRTDRDAYLRVAGNAPAEYGVIAGRRLSDHDLCSIMHYSPRTTDPDWFGLTQAGQQALASCGAKLAAGCRKVGQRCQLSGGDVASLRALYP